MTSSKKTMMKKKTHHPTSNIKIPQKSQVRIIGGQHKRRLIDFVAVDGLRPTPDRLRETLFNWLMYDLQGATVLDVCAGSGVLGFEAISRGASRAILIEFDRQQSTQLKATAQALKADTVQILHGDCLAILPTLTIPFDIVFIDPPYSLGLWQAILDKLILNQLISQQTLLYIESDRPITDIIVTPMRILKESKVGGVLAYLVHINNELFL